MPCLFPVAALFQVDLSSNTTCYYAGTITPLDCPSGTICGVPYLPPIPAPPGYAETVSLEVNADWDVDGIAFRNLVPCAPGDYCNLGRSLNNGSLECPAVRHSIPMLL